MMLPRNEAGDVRSREGLKILLTQCKPMGFGRSVAGFCTLSGPIFIRSTITIVDLRWVSYRSDAP